MEVHIGKEIEKIYQESGIKLSEFAKRINTSPRNVYSIFARPEIKTDQLQIICEVLGFNFFTFFEKGSSSKVKEPAETYRKKSDTVTVTLELDGTKTTLDRHIKKITAINSILK